MDNQVATGDVSRLTSEATKSKWIKWVIALVAVALLSSGATYVVLTSQPQQRLQQPTPTPLPAEVSTKEDDPTANWKTFSNNDYSLRYASEWVATTTKYLNSTELENTGKTVAIIISKGQYPYGFEGPNNTFDSKEIKITIAGKEYTDEETIVNNRKAFVDFKIDSSKNHHILFGTGYPAAVDDNASLTDYQALKPTILQILSTFQFTEK